VSAVTVGSSGSCCSISLCKSLLGSGASSHGLTVVTQAVLYASRWHSISLPSCPSFHTPPSFLFALRVFNTFAPQSATRPSQIHIRRLQTLLTVKPLNPPASVNRRLSSSSICLHFLFSQNNLARYLLNTNTQYLSFSWLLAYDLIYWGRCSVYFLYIFLYISNVLAA
jgi:hypothetical protein